MNCVLRDKPTGQYLSGGTSGSWGYELVLSLQEARIYSAVGHAKNSRRRAMQRMRRASDDPPIELEVILVGLVDIGVAE